MSAESVRKLLNLPADVRQPHAYQILGLSDGEQDAGVIQHATQAAIQRLRAARPTSDPAAWNLAAQLVQQAHSVLNDPQQKADLDARFGIIAMADDDEFNDSDFGNESFASDALDSPQQPSVDPLAGLLPNANPLAPAMSPAPSPDAVPQNVQLHPQTLPPVNAQLAAPETAPVFSPPKLKTSSKLKRRRSPLPMLLFGFVVIGLTFTAMSLAYYLLWGPGQIAVNTTENGIQITTHSPVVDDASQASAPTPSPSTQRKRQDDPVMGSLGPELPDDTSAYAAPLAPDPAPDMETNDMSPFTIPPMETMNPNLAAPDNPAPDNPTPDTAMTPAQETAPAQQPAPMPTTSSTDPQKIAAADAALEQAEAAIRSTDWANMKTLAESAEAAAATDQQRQTATAIFQLADLASYYHGGIERALKDLQVGNTFEVTDGFEVAIVDVTSDKLTVRTAAKNRSFEIDRLPLVLAHKLASFYVDADATGLAAKAAYQAVTPVSDSRYRDEAIMWLEQIDDEVEGATPESVIAAIRTVYED